MSKAYLTLTDLVAEEPMSMSVHPKHNRIVTLRFKGGLEAYVIKGLPVVFVKVTENGKEPVITKLGVSLEDHIRRLFSL